jgi:hypothetical protein
MPIRVAVDPDLGRLSFATGETPMRVRVGYAYGFSGDLGGGPYDRRAGLGLWLDDEVKWQIGVTSDRATRTQAPDPAQLVGSIRDAVSAWNTHVQAHPGAFGVITVMDSDTYGGDLTGPAFGIVIPQGSRLAIVAADWPVSGDPASPRRTVGAVGADGPFRPHLQADVSVRGTAPPAGANPGELILDGLLVEGQVTVLAGNLGALRLIDCTVVPGNGGLVVNPSISQGQQNARLRVAVDRSILGPVSLPETVPSLHISDSIVDPDAIPDAISAPGAELDIQRTTVFGRTEARQLDAGNDLFLGPPAIERLQAGCVRFSYVPHHPDTATPRRFRCQPDLAVEGVDDPDLRERTRLEVEPSFRSTRYGDPAYGQLGPSCANEIKTGAENGAEMGALETLLQPQREADLRSALDEYLRFGLEAGVFHVT